MKNRSPIGTGCTLNAISRLLRPTERVPFGILLPALYSPTPLVSRQGPTSDFTLIPKSHFNIPMIWGGIGIKAGTSQISLFD